MLFAISRDVYKLLLDDGASPIDEFLAGVKDKATRARIVRQIDKMERGNFGTHNEFDGIGELKIDIGPGYRVYYGKYGDIIVILLGGGDKKSQQTDIATAKKRWEAWQNQGADITTLPSWSEAEQQNEQNNDDKTI